MNGVIPINKFPKNKWDPRDHQYHKLATASAPFDWSKGYDVEQELAKVLNKPGFRIPAKDQKESFSCGGQAGSYYRAGQEAFQTGNFTERSAKDIYSQIFYSEGGIMPRDLPNLLCKAGNCQEQLIPSKQISGDVPEWFMRERKQTEMTKNDALLAKTLNYASVSISMDSLAQAIRDNHGIVITVGGKDNGTWRTAYPVPPASARDEEWAHFLYCFGAKMVNGKKMLMVKNSWGDQCGDHGTQYLGENYLPHISNAYAIYDPDSPIINPERTWLDRLLTISYTLFLRLTGHSTKKALTVN
jgi:hypothetical protein